MKDYSNLEKTIRYKFHDRSLLKTALTHSSYASEHNMNYNENNERLEFIGDAYLDAIVGHCLLEKLDSAHEGELSRKRADVVCEYSLAGCARKIELGNFLILGKGENSCGGREKDSILADAFEALLGAIIIDGGFEEGKRVIQDTMADKIEDAISGKLSRDFKSRLQEIIQEHNNTLKVRYVLVDENGPDHNKTFTIDVVIADKVLATGIGKSKSKAEQAAAREVVIKDAWKSVL